MGLYTTIVIGGREGQVKLWNNHDDLVMAELNSGDNVPEIHGHTTYSIAILIMDFLFLIRKENPINLVNRIFFLVTGPENTSRMLLEK